MDADQNRLEANMSTLIISIASSATLAMGLIPDPTTKKIEKDLAMAAFNIDLLRMLNEKTKNNLNTDEKQFLDTVLNDLQLKFIQAKG